MVFSNDEIYKEIRYFSKTVCYAYFVVERFTDPLPNQLVSEQILGPNIL